METMCPDLRMVQREITRMDVVIDGLRVSTRWVVFFKLHLLGCVKWTVFPCTIVGVRNLVWQRVI